MPKCPVCGHELPPGAKYCPPSATIGGCESIRIEEVFRGPRSGKHSHKKGIAKPLTDYQRARKAYGEDCMLSPVGPLPTAKEMRPIVGKDAVPWGN